MINQKVIAGDERVLGFNGLIAVQIDRNQVLNLRRRFNQAADRKLRQVKFAAKGIEGQRGRVVIVGQEIPEVIRRLDRRFKGLGVIALIGHQRAVDHSPVRNDLIPTHQDDILQVRVGRNGVVQKMFDRLGYAIGRLGVAQFGNVVLIPGVILIPEGEVALEILHQVQIKYDAVDRWITREGVQIGHQGIDFALIETCLQESRTVCKDDRFDARVGCRRGKVALRFFRVGRECDFGHDGDIERERLADGCFLAGDDSEEIRPGQLMNLVFDQFISRRVCRAALD